MISDISNQYTVTEINKFDNIQERCERLTSNDEYGNFVTAHIEAAAECIPTKTRAECSISWKSIAVSVV